jgi:hypothetical protein
MSKFPVDAPIGRVVLTLQRLGFTLIREGNHVSMLRQNLDGTNTPLTIPNHLTIKKSILRTALTQVGISREAFLKVYEE